MKHIKSLLLWILLLPFAVLARDIDVAGYDWNSVQVVNIEHIQYWLAVQEKITFKAADVGTKINFRFRNNKQQTFEFLSPYMSIRWKAVSAVTAYSKTDNCVIATEACDVVTGEVEGPISPIIIDLGQDGFHLGEVGVGVYFDFNGDGALSHVQWLEENGNDAFLGLDLNGNGLVDDGLELFGDNTIMLASGKTAENGFQALAQYDNPLFGGNDDGVLSQEDLVWGQLILWLDKNADGIATDEEILTLAKADIKSFEVTPKINNARDHAGNLMPLWAWATNGRETGNSKHKMVDVFFQPI